MDERTRTLPETNRPAPRALEMPERRRGCLGCSARAVVNNESRTRPMVKIVKANA